VNERRLEVGDQLRVQHELARVGDCERAAVGGQYTLGDAMLTGDARVVDRVMSGLGIVNVHLVDVPVVVLTNRDNALPNCGGEAKAALPDLAVSVLRLAQLGNRRTKIGLGADVIPRHLVHQERCYGVIPL